MIWYKITIKNYTKISFLEKITDIRDWIIQKLILNNIIVVIVYSLYTIPLNSYVMVILVAITYIYTFNSFKKILVRYKTID